MKYFAISSDADTLTGLRLAGIEGEIASNKHEVERLVKSAVKDESIAVLIVTHGCYVMCREFIDVIKLSAQRPLVSVIPSASGERASSDYILKLIREAIGVKL